MPSLPLEGPKAVEAKGSAEGSVGMENIRVGGKWGQHEKSYVAKVK